MDKGRATAPGEARSCCQMLSTGLYHAVESLRQHAGYNSLLLAHLDEQSNAEAVLRDIDQQLGHTVALQRPQTAAAGGCSCVSHRTLPATMMAMTCVILQSHRTKWPLAHLDIQGDAEAVLRDVDHELDQAVALWHREQPLAAVAHATDLEDRLAPRRRLVVQENDGGALKVDVAEAPENDAAVVQALERGVGDAQVARVPAAAFELVAGVHSFHQPACKARA